MLRCYLETDTTLQTKLDETGLVIARPSNANGAPFERILNLSPGVLGESLTAGDVFKEDVALDNSLGDAYFLDVYDLNDNGCECRVISYVV